MRSKPVEPSPHSACSACSLGAACGGYGMFIFLVPTVKVCRNALTCRLSNPPFARRYRLWLNDIMLRRRRRIGPKSQQPDFIGHLTHSGVRQPEARAVRHPQTGRFWLSHVDARCRTGRHRRLLACRLHKAFQEHQTARSIHDELSCSRQGQRPSRSRNYLPRQKTSKTPDWKE